MTGARIDVEWESGAVQDALRRLTGTLELTKPIFEDIGAAVESSVRLRFRDSKGPDGTPWIPSLRTLEAEFDGRSAKTLIDSRILLESIHATASDGEAVVGTNIVYAAIHQFGGRAGRGHASKIPARPFLGVSDADEDEILAIVTRHARTALG